MHNRYFSEVRRHIRSVIILIEGDPFCVSAFLTTCCVRIQYWRELSVDVNNVDDNITTNGGGTRLSGYKVLVSSASSHADVLRIYSRLGGTLVDALLGGRSATVVRAL